MESYADVLDWPKLVEERNVWVAYNFPDPDGSRTPLDSVLGCIEELGELTHHHLKQVQSIRGDDAHHEAEAKDAIGDLSVYLMGVMSHFKVFPLRPLEALIMAGYSADSILLRVAQQVGGLSSLDEYHPDHVRKSKAADYVTGITISLYRYCQVRKWDYKQIVIDTWNHVKQRDWIKYPENGMPPEDPPYEDCPCSDQVTSMDCPIHGW